MNDDVSVQTSDIENHSIVTEAGQIFLNGHIGASEMHSIVPVILNFAALWNTEYTPTRWEQFKNFFATKRNMSQSMELVIESPYKVSYDLPLLDFYISGHGTDFCTFSQIASAISLAKSRGIICRTTVTGMAAGIAGILATMGTPGFRVMYEGAYNCLVVPTELDKSNKAPRAGFNCVSSDRNNDAKLPKWATGAYQTNTNLTPSEIETVMAKRNGVMDTRFCASHGVCDWILKQNGGLECVISRRHNR